MKYSNVKLLKKNIYNFFYRKMPIAMISQKNKKRDHYDMQILNEKMGFFNLLMLQNLKTFNENYAFIFNF